MPVASASPSDRHRMVRMLRCVRGEISFDIEVAPRFDYGRRPHQLSLNDDGALFQTGETRLALSLIREESDGRLARYEATDDGDLRSTLQLSQGQMRGVVLETGPDVGPHVMRAAEAQRLADDTARFWHDWLSQSTYAGRWREELERSAITLKLLTYAPTGALVASPSAGLPNRSVGNATGTIGTRGSAMRLFRFTPSFGWDSSTRQWLSASGAGTGSLSIWTAIQDR